MNNKAVLKRDKASSRFWAEALDTRERLHWWIPLFVMLVLLLPSVAIAATEPGPVTATDDEPKYSSVEERRLLLSLEKERKKLAREQKALEERKKELKTLEAEVDKKLDQLQKLKENIEKLLAEKKAEEQRRIDNLNKMYERVSPNLSKMYEKMDPRKAATILATVDQDLAIAILFRMKPKSAAKILSNMDRDKAASLTSAFPNLGAM